MTEAVELVESTVVVPEKGNVTANFTLEPTGADKVWTLKDSTGAEFDTFRIQFEGVKEGGKSKSGKATLIVSLIGTDLVFAKQSGKFDGLETYDDVNGGIDAIKRSQVDTQNTQILEIDLKANSKTPSGFAFKWAAKDTTGNVVLSADPQTEIDPL
ncbi:hypothetical protein [Microbulbifer agarilyticus]|uniref:hypothetical protein n=1 Tax=Microbulbifer agarilyticus TaxID=260552 RepID=UPI001CD27052|nr:hypothetical protein [Microbulbifer agarilyticus]MCA0892803.1 hypothetical protein [Microbulbifer agarilyticus]